MRSANKVTIEVSVDVRDRIHAAAKVDGRTMDEYLRRIVPQETKQP